MDGHYLTIVLLIIWVIGIFIELVCKSNEVYWIKDCPDRVFERKRVPTVKEAWACVLWPVCLVWIALKGIVVLINTIVAFFLLLVGIKYAGSKLYNKIDNLV